MRCRLLSRRGARHLRVVHVKARTPPEHSLGEGIQAAVMRNYSKCLSTFLWMKRGLILILPPLLLIPLPAVVGTPASYAGYILILMAIYWLTEVLPLPVTALIPIVLVPMFMLTPSKELCMQYMANTNVLFIGGLMIATAVERWGLHRRIALGAMLLIGTSYRRLMLGFMLPTWFLSMWISNTATTAMMVPIVEAVLMQLKEHSTKKSESQHIEMSSNRRTSQNQVDAVEVSVRRNSRTDEKSVREDEDEEHSNLAKAMCLSIAYAASCGGIGTLTGTGPNLMLNNEVSKSFKSHSNFGFGSWMVYAVPISLVALLFVWLWLQLWFLGFRNFFNCQSNKEQEEAAKEVIRRNYRALGPVSFPEGSVIFFFIVAVLLWLSRDPGVPGWRVLFEKNGTQYVRDEQVAILIPLLMFMWPSKNPFRFCRNRSYELEEDEKEEEKAEEGSTLLTWPDLLYFPWNIVLLLGGGFALAHTCKASGLSLWIGEQLSVLKSVPTAGLVVLITAGSAIFTEFTSNTATATILLPILNNLASCIKIHPFLLMMPATIGCSLAFCLPVATPPNAIVFAKGYLSVADMVKVGIFLNIVCVLITTGGTLSYGAAFFKLNEFPTWALPCANSTSGAG